MTQNHKFIIEINDEDLRKLRDTFEENFEMRNLNDVDVIKEVFFVDHLNEFVDVRESIKITRTGTPKQIV